MFDEQTGARSRRRQSAGVRMQCKRCVTILPTQRQGNKKEKVSCTRKTAPHRISPPPLVTRIENYDLCALAHSHTSADICTPRPTTHTQTTITQSIRWCTPHIECRTPHRNRIDSVRPVLGANKRNVLAVLSGMPDVYDL